MFKFTKTYFQPFKINFDGTKTALKNINSNIKNKKKNNNNLFINK